MIQQGLAAGVLSLCIVAAGCGRFDATSSATESSSGTTTARVRSKADLENAVVAKLKVDERLRSAELSVSADTEKNEITLSGAVQSNELREKAIELARSAHPGVTVNDLIDVQSSGSQDRAPSRKRTHA